MSGSKHILVVSPVPSHPQDQGNSARIVTLARQLFSRGFKLDFLYYGMEGLNPSQEAAMRAFWTDFRFMRSLPLKPMAFPEYWGIDDWCPDQLADVAAQMHRMAGYSAVIVNYVWMSKVLKAIEGAVKVIDTHDLFGDRHILARRHGLEPRWYFTSRAEEDRAFRRADVVIGIQSAETQAIKARFDGTVLTVGHQSTSHFLAQSYENGPLIAGFGYLGSANPWNVMSIAALDAEMAKRNGPEWLLAGSISRQRLTLRSMPLRLGFVDQLDDFYSAVGCIINPMMGGTGLKIKTIEALSYGKAVIGTKDAFEGLPTTHEFHQLKEICDMVSVIEDLAKSDDARRELRIVSRSVFFDYERMVHRHFDELVDRLCG